MMRNKAFIMCIIFMGILAACKSGSADSKMVPAGDPLSLRQDRPADNTVPAPVPAMDTAPVEDISPCNSKPAKKIAYLTFDDGPSKNITASVLDTLKSNGIKATFFVLPKGHLDSMYRRILDEGHAMGNHSFSHNYRYLYSSTDNFKKDLLKAERFIDSRFHYNTTLYRFPGGSFGRKKKMIRARAGILENLGYQYFDWDVSTGDTDPNVFKHGTTKQITSRMVNNVVGRTHGRDRLIVLMHDSAGKVYTAKALPEIIKGLEKQGYTFDVLTRNTPKNHIS